ncbi:hypothetical protein B0J11DRAFT_20362 [Dendryphion nanum]|uniref:Uncharacterized protein n=1 Tax=Dendryphion nanum TaxID=256645 RepID=A0A9P9J070_9PLEO|nr:hypothetical protein B0J11DRAFT_20362 [Dendryphion nanum]
MLVDAGQHNRNPNKPASNLFTPSPHLTSPNTTHCLTLHMEISHRLECFRHCNIPPPGPHRHAYCPLTLTRGTHRLPVYQSTQVAPVAQSHPITRATPRDSPSKSRRNETSSPSTTPQSDEEGKNKKGKRGVVYDLFQVPNYERVERSGAIHLIPYPSLPNLLPCLPFPNPHHTSASDNVQRSPPPLVPLPLPPEPSLPHNNLPKRKESNLVIQVRYTLSSFQCMHASLNLNPSPNPKSGF